MPQYPIERPAGIRLDLDDLARSQAVVLVEGLSDRVALETLAARRNRALAAQRVSIVAMGGATNIVHFLYQLGWDGVHRPDITLAGLCDAGQQSCFRRALERAGFGSVRSTEQMEALGFYVCTADLEDELIRALGVTAVEEILQAQGELGSFRTFQRQPAQQARHPASRLTEGQLTEGQLRRFMATKSGRKRHYARLLADAVDLSRVPRPLDGVLARV